MRRFLERAEEIWRESLRMLIHLLTILELSHKTQVLETEIRQRTVLRLCTFMLVPDEFSIPVASVHHTNDRGRCLK